MVDLNSVLDHARQLSLEDRAKLLDALWDSVPFDWDMPLHPDWATELERRVARLKAGTEKAIPWHQIREEALARIGQDTGVAV